MGHVNEAILIIQFEAIVGKLIIALNILDEFKIMELKGRVAHNENQPNYRCCLFFFAYSCFFFYQYELCIDIFWTINVTSNSLRYVYHQYQHPMLILRHHHPHCCYYSLIINYKDYCAIYLAGIRPEARDIKTKHELSCVRDIQDLGL